VPRSAGGRRPDTGRAVGRQSSSRPPGPRSKVMTIIEPIRRRSAPPPRSPSVSSGHRWLQTPLRCALPNAARTPSPNPVSSAEPVGWRPSIAARAKFVGFFTLKCRGLTFLCRGWDVSAATSAVTRRPSYWR
jgi:hypothetical protein